MAWGNILLNTARTSLFHIVAVLTLVAAQHGCGSMYQYYTRADAATITTNGLISAMDADTRSRRASVFYVQPGLRVIGLDHKSSDVASRILILDVQPRGGYRVIYSPSAGGDAWKILARGKTAQPNYRWCSTTLSCQANEPFDQCVLRHCP